MKGAALGIALVLLLSGLVLRFMMRQHRTEAGKAAGWFNARAWFVPWSSVDYLTPTGMRLHLTSLACIMIGIFAYLWAKTMP